MNRALKTTVLVAACAMGLGGVAVAQSDGAGAVEARQAHYKALGGAFGAINGELRKEAPDLKAININALKMKALAADLPTWFPKGSGPEAGAKTAAKPEIWSDPSGFAEAAKGLRDQTAKLADLSAGADLDAVKAQVRATGGACKACHDTYRAQAQK